MTDDGVIRDQILERFRQKAEGYRARDLAAVTSLYWQSDELEIFDPVPPLSYRGFQRTWQQTKDFIDGCEGPLLVDYGDHHVHGSGDVACSWSIIHIRTKRASGPDVDLRLRQTDVWRRIDGEWYIVHEHNSEPMDPARGAEQLNL